MNVCEEAAQRKHPNTDTQREVLRLETHSQPLVRVSERLQLLPPPPPPAAVSL